MILTLLSVDTRTKQDLTEKYYKLLPKDRLTKINKLRSNEQASISMYTGLLIAYRIATDTNCDISKIRLEYNKYGKPYTNLNKNYQFSVSHSSNSIAYIGGTTSYEVGVDIEHIRPCNLKLAKRYFSENEYRYLTKAPADKQNYTFTKLWTMKEAYVKMMGTGLSTPLDSFSVINPENNNIYYTIEHNNSVATVCYHNASQTDATPIVKVMTNYELIEAISKLIN